MYSQKQDVKRQVKYMQEKLKVIFVSLIVFLGTAFAIMSFNEDVAVTEMFKKVYLIITGTTHEGFGVLEFFYGIGIALGITVFFNRFSKKENAEPTPIELKMKQYADDIDDYMNGGTQ